MFGDGVDASPAVIGVIFPIPSHQEGIWLGMPLKKSIKK